MEQHEEGAVGLRVPQCPPGGVLPAERLDATKSHKEGIRRPRTLLFAPAYNEEGRIGKVVASAPREHVDKILVVDDGSSDRTCVEASEAGAEVIRQSTKCGVGAALRVAIQYARAQGYDIIIVIAGNGKDNPAEIPSLVAPIIEEGCDYVQGSRYLPGGVAGEMPLHRRIGTRLYPLIIRIMTRYPATDATNGFRAYRTSIFNDPRIDINQHWLDTYEMEYYVHCKVISLGYKVKEVPVSKLYPQHVSYRHYTKARPLVDWWHMLRPVIYLTFRHR
jgi:dolichol-phosphate mannosyltransferase